MPLKQTWLFDTFDPMVERFCLDGPRVIALLLDEMLPELALMALDQHLGDMLDEEET